MQSWIPGYRRSTQRPPTIPYAYHNRSTGDSSPTTIPGTPYHAVIISPLLRSVRSNASSFLFSPALRADAAVLRRQRELLRPAQRPPQEQGAGASPPGGGRGGCEAPLPYVCGASTRRERLRRPRGLGVSGTCFLADIRHVAIGPTPPPAGIDIDHGGPPTPPVRTPSGMESSIRSSRDWPKAVIFR